MNERSRYIIGVDIGTGSTKTIAADAAGKVYASYQQGYDTFQPRQLYSEQDPEKLLQAVKAGIASVVQQLGYPPAAITFSAAMHGLIAMDAGGTALTPLITWADNRSYEVAAALKDTDTGHALYHQTGTPVHAMSPLCKIMWLREQQPAIFARTAMFAGIKSYLFHHLLQRYVTDHAMASATGMLDIHTLEWSKLALDTAGISKAQLPELVRTRQVLTGLAPAIAAELGIPASTPLIAGGSDGCLAQLGSAAMDAGHATLTIGTSGAVRMAVGQPVTDIHRRLFTYVLTENQFITGGATNNGGAVVQWFVVHFLQQPATAVGACVEQALALPPGGNGLLCLPYLFGERAPVWDSSAQGMFTGVQSTHTAMHFLRAILEGICFNLLSIAAALEETVQPIQQVAVSGGFTASRGWMQLLADVFRKPVSLQQQSDASAMGAIILALQALGLPDQDFEQTAPEEVFAPDEAAAAIYQKNYVQFKTLYAPQVKKEETRG
ncbi:gluconokinase [Chitinophaga defluvii]|uniref:Gluconokinase n=1 Tax=Chitinophaga defluvii TaxID=3163343 RepID=A0ABV2T7V9_9BACT